MINRRAFLRLASAAAITAVAPLKLVAPELHARVVTKLTLAELVSDALQARAVDIASNITHSNALFHKLKGRK